MQRAIKALLLLPVLGGGCATTSSLPPMPSAECGVLQDLIVDLDSPALAKDQNGSDNSPSEIPAFPKLNYVAGYGPNKADLHGCTTLLSSVGSRTKDSIGYAQERFHDGARVDFSRVTFESNQMIAHVHYGVSYGPLAAQGWSLTLTKQSDGKWKLTAWKLEMES